MDHEDALQILDLVESGIIMLDSEEHIVFWNRFISHTSQMNFDSIKNQAWLDVFPTLKNSRIHKAVEKAVKMNFPSILSYKLLKTQFPLYKKSLATRPPYLIVQSIIVKPLKEGRMNKGCIIYINDVSAASKRENELNQQSIELSKTIRRYSDVKSRLQQIFDRAHNGIIIFDVNGRVINANNAATGLFERDLEEIIDTDISELIPKLKEIFYNSSEGAYCYLSNVDHEFDQHINLSCEKYFSVSVSQIGEKGDGDFFVFLSDITERKQAEKKLLNANVELEEFAYRTSHDLRSPIVSSLGLVSVAKQSIDAGNSSKAHDCLLHIENSLSKLEALIKDILRLTEVENMEESEQEVDIQVTIDDVLESMCQLEGFEKVKKITCLDDVGRIYVKQSRFRMILENLMSNAIKYHDPLVDSPFIKVQSFLCDTYVTIDVFDNGLGIPEDQQYKLFEMFNRFHPKVAFGSGLGLYLIKKSAHVLGGDIEYIPQEKGACFRLTIPQKPKELL